MSNAYFTAYDRLLSLSNLSLRNYSDSPRELNRSLERTHDFLGELNHPENSLKTIHIAGTSGKGSVTNYLHEILWADRKSVGSYNTPHTTTYLERFKVGDRLISPTLLTRCINDVFAAYERFLAKNSSELSFFELSTCLAFHALREAGCEWCVLETGCGGRWDATNVIPTPKVAIITNIDRDHTELLGNALSSIAYEKAGIIKKGGIVFCGEVRPALKKVFMNEAVKQEAALFFVPPPSARKVPDVLGRHQQHNAALAESAALEIGVKPEVIKKALEETSPLPCRFETIQENPLIIIDGAHNLAKMKTTAALMKNLGQKMHVIFGCKASKDSEGMLKVILPYAKTVTTTRFTQGYGKATNPALILSQIPKSKRAGFFLDHREALKHVRALAKNEPILITGSLYLAGEMRAHWVPEAAILKHRSSFPQ